MSEGPKPHRRWLQFSLRTFLILVTIPGAWFGWQWHQVRDRDRILESRDFLRALEFQSGFKDMPAGARARMRRKGYLVAPQQSQRERRSIPALWPYLGAEPLDMDIRLPDDKFTEADLRRIKSLYPECHVKRIPAVDDVRRSPKLN